MEDFIYQSAASKDVVFRYHDLTKDHSFLHREGRLHVRGNHSHIRAATHFDVWSLDRRELGTINVCETLGVVLRMAFGDSAFSRGEYQWSVSSDETFQMLRILQLGPPYVYSDSERDSVYMQYPRKLFSLSQREIRFVFGLFGIDYYRRPVPYQPMPPFTYFPVYLRPLVANSSTIPSLPVGEGGVS